MLRCASVLCLGLAFIGGAAEAQERPKGKRRRPPTAASVENVESPAPVSTPSAEPIKPPRAAWEPTPKDGQPLLGSHVYEEGAADLAGEAQQAFDATFAADGRLRHRDLAELLEPPEEAQAALAEAGERLEAAQVAFDQMDLQGARAATETALATFERYLPQLAGDEGGLNRLRDAWIRLAAIRFFDGDQDGAREALRRVFPLDPKLEYSAKAFPPRMKKLVVEARLLFDALGTGKLVVQSDPGGAMVYLNGAVRGAAPVELDEVAAGPAYVTLVRRGYAQTTVTIEVNGGAEARCEHAFARVDDDPITPLITARSKLGAAEAPGELQEAMRRLRVDLLALLEVERGSAGLRLRAHLYDARSKQLLKRVEQTGPESALGERVKRLAADLLAGARLDGLAVAAATVEKPGFFSRLGSALGDGFGAWRSWKYFWYSVGAIGAVVVIGAAVGIGVAASPRGTVGRMGLTPAEEIILLGGAGPRRGGF